MVFHNKQDMEVLKNYLKKLKKFIKKNLLKMIS